MTDNMIVATLSQQLEYWLQLHKLIEESTLKLEVGDE